MKLQNLLFILLGAFLSGPTQAMVFISDKQPIAQSEQALKTQLASVKQQINNLAIVLQTFRHPLHSSIECKVVNTLNQQAKSKTYIPETDLPIIKYTLIALHKLYALDMLLQKNSTFKDFLETTPSLTDCVTALINAISTLKAAPSTFASFKYQSQVIMGCYNLLIKTYIIHARKTIDDNLTPPPYYEYSDVQLDSQELLARDKCINILCEKYSSLLSDPRLFEAQALKTKKARLESELEHLSALNLLQSTNLEHDIQQATSFTANNNYFTEEFAAKAPLIIQQMQATLIALEANRLRSEETFNQLISTTQSLKQLEPCVQGIENERQITLEQLLAAQNTPTTKKQLYVTHFEPKKLVKEDLITYVKLFHTYFDYINDSVQEVLNGVKSQLYLPIASTNLLDQLFSTFDTIQPDDKTVFDKALTIANQDTALQPYIYALIQKYMIAKGDTALGKYEHAQGFIWELAVATWFYTQLKAKNSNEQLTGLDVHLCHATDFNITSQEFDTCSSHFLLECKNTNWFKNSISHKKLEQLANQKKIASSLHKKYLVISKQELSVSLNKQLTQLDIAFISPDQTTWKNFDKRQYPTGHNPVLNLEVSSLYPNNYYKKGIAS